MRQETWKSEFLKSNPEIKMRGYRMEFCYDMLFITTFVSVIQRILDSQCPPTTIRGGLTVALWHQRH